jgi:octaprenyl-diphosphate synthase
VDVSRDNADVCTPRYMELPTARNMPEDVPWREIPPLRLIDRHLRQVRDLIHQSLMARSSGPELTPFLSHLRARGGKMLRPALVLLAGRCFGPVTDEHLRVGAIMEMIHHATLLHDDVIDEGGTRRGIPTANRLWGNESAVLLGDFILSQVFRMTGDIAPAAARIVAQTAVRVCEGELRQVAQRRNWRLSEAEYLDIITEKSAAFFGGCCRLGALLARADEGHIEALARFGLYTGIAFQITDDLLDITGDESETGKTTQSDFATDKLTLAVIHLLQAVDPEQRESVHALLESPEASRCGFTEMLVRHGSLKYAHEQAGDYVRKAAGALAGLPAGEAKDALIETARFMADRAA